MSVPIVHGAACVLIVAFFTRIEPGHCSPCPCRTVMAILGMIIDSVVSATGEVAQ